MKKVRKLFLTTVALTATGLFMKSVAVWFNVYVTNKIGSAGIGLFQLILSVYAMAKTLASSGFHLAATRIWIDTPQSARTDQKKLFLGAFLIGIFSFSLLFFLSGTLSFVWIDDARAAIPLRILSLALPFLSLSTALNGYMTAVRKMSRYSLIQLLEQIVRIAFTVGIIRIVQKSGSESVLILVCAGITVSEAFSFFLSVSCYLWDIRKLCGGKKKEKGFLKRTLRVAVPDAMGAYLRSALNTVEHLLIPVGIRKSGADKEKALSEYGAVQGMALPVLLYPSSVLGVVSGLLVPEIAECRIRKNEKEIAYIVNRVLHLSLYFSLFCSAAMFLLAKEFSAAIYQNQEAEPFIRLLAPLIPVMYLDMTTDGMLKGMDRQFTLMQINLLDSTLCVVLVALLVPKIAVTGYVVTIYAAEIINFLCSFFTLCRETRLRFSLVRHLVLPLAASLFSVQIGKALFSVVKRPTPGLICSLGVGLICYSVFLRFFGGISKEDRRWIRGVVFPKIKP